MERREVKDGEDMSFDFIKTVISDIGLSAEAELYSCEDGTRRITIVGDDASALIGHHGDTLDALQYLANLASAKKNVNGERDKSRVTLDIEGYRAKREATLRALARRMGAKALKSRRSIMLEPMSAYERRIIISGDDASVLIGHHGDTLDALQHLANLASARKNINGERDKSRVTIDIEGYRAKREETLRALARRMAAKALRNKRSVMLEPMSAYERRIIHSEIQGIEGVSTNSIGSDNNRKIVIFLTDKKPKGIFEEDKEEAEVSAQLDEVIEESVESTEATEE